MFLRMPKEQAEHDKFDCFSNADCSKQVETKITEIKASFLPRLEFLKEKSMPSEAKLLVRHLRDALAKAGVPKSRTEYLAVRWVESIFPEALKPEHHEVPEAVEEHIVIDV